MSDLIIVAFPDEATAFAAGKALVALQKEHLIEMEDVVVVTRDDTGKVSLHQSVNLTTGGAIGGGIWGTLIGLLFLNPIVGAAVGAGAGALAGKFSDIGIDDQFLRDIGQSLDKGGAAVGLLIRKLTTEKVLERLEPYREKGRVLHTSLSNEAEARLKEFLEKVPPLHMPHDQLGGGRK
ncbi:MAG: DUF1269 domain-containing protein [Tabrizicola sp.]|uniref:DUF1269 domain-containing protein n=1 Tax=Tabrizicola sp. TaxID=2005166 RepID=UPI002736EC27|nr:DUF1269 domain-containing protein [Tabrizicola sp.]MDP3261550.1 DUF1269 domain-containing protein [Tabrizicola sp.]MDP3648381.1 DUF1269 domain-containing protein [Paracoccaceae bacterium]MDZ4065383.1 DUF1269 domain-containing protein [Tabrizicola sp.]